MTDIAKEFLEGIKLGDYIRVIYGTEESQVITEGIVLKWSEILLYLQDPRGNAVKIRLDDNIRFIENIDKDEEETALSETDKDSSVSSKAVKKDAPEHRILRQIADLEAAEPFNFNYLEVLSSIGRLLKKSNNSKLRREIGGIIASTKTAINNKDYSYKYHDLRARTIKAGNLCTETNEYDLVYMLIGTLSLTAQDYEYALEPLIRAKKYQLGSFAASKGNLTLSAQILSICSLLSRETSNVNKYIAELLVARRDTETVKELVKEYKENEDICEKLLSCAHMLFLDSKASLSSEITPYDTAFDAANKLLESIPISWTVEKSAYSYWKELEAIPYPVSQSNRMADPISYIGYIMTYNRNERWGFIRMNNNKNHYFYIAQVTTDEKGVMLRKMLSAGLWNNLEVNFLVGKSSIKKGQTAAYRIELSANGYDDAVKRINALNDEGGRHKGFIEMYYPLYSTGRIQEGKNRYFFKLSNITDPWLRAYYRESFSPKDQNVSFSISGKNAFDIRWLDPSDNEKDLFLDSVTEAEIEEWNDLINRKGQNTQVVVIPDTDPYSNFEYTSLDATMPQSNENASKLLTYGGKTPIKLSALNRYSNHKSIVETDLQSNYVPGEEFAFLVMVTNNFGRMHKAYEPSFSGTSKEKPIIFETPKISFSTGKRPNTKNSVWLVRFKKKGNMLNPFDKEYYPTVEKGSTVEIIKEYRKNIIKRLDVVENSVVLEEYLEAPKASITARHDKVPNKLIKVAEPIDGESLIILNKRNDFSDASLYKCSYYEENIIAIDNDGKSIYLNDINDIKEGYIWRFGHITDYMPDDGIGVINNTWQFSLDVAIPVLNILKTQKMAQNGVIGLYCIFTWNDGIIRDVRRIRDVLECVPWIRSKVTYADRLLSDINLETEYGTKLVHHSTVETDPFVNRCFNQGALIGKNLWAKSVDLAWRIDSTPSEDFQIYSEAIALHSIEQEAIIQYVEKTDSYEGYVNQTEKYPVFGTRSVLQNFVGKTTTVVFVSTFNGNILEGRIKEDIIDSDEDNSDITETYNDVDDSNIYYTPLVQMHLNTINISQTNLRRIDVDENGMPRNSRSAINAFRNLVDSRRIDYPRNWQNHLFAAKIARAFPDDIRKNFRINVNRLLLGVLRMRVRAISRSSDIIYGELAYGLSTLMHFDRQNKDANYHIWLLLQDFGTADEIQNFENRKKNEYSVSINELFERPREYGFEDRLLSHLIMMDLLSIEEVCPVLEKDELLFRQLKEIANSIIENQSRHIVSLSDIVKLLKRELKFAIQECSRNIADQCMRKSNICEEVRNQLLVINKRWSRVICSEDSERIARIIDACNKATNYSKSGGFEQQEKELTDSWRSFDSVEKDSFEHPCMLSTEVLLINQYLKPGINLFSKLKEESANKLSHLYNEESRPVITCELNEETISYRNFSQGETDIELIIKNGDSRHMLQPAENIIIRLECLNNGIYITPEIHIDNKLAAGAEVSVIAYITATDEDTILSTDVITFTWQAEFLYSGQFEDGHTIQKQFITNVNVDPLRLELVADLNEQKNILSVNPYKEAAKGNPLEENSKVYRHRMEEDEIIRSIIRIDENGNEQFIAGATVIVHGQKKSGKTSLMNQIKAYIDRSPELSDKAIIIDFDSVLSNIGNINSITHFMQAFCDAILQRFSAQMNKHIDVWDMLEEKGVEIPDLWDEVSTAAAYGRFSRFLSSFSELDHNYHTIILFMDEFTSLCTSLLTEIATAQLNNDFALVNYLQHIPDFIKDFSGKGFVQIVIGHENMMRSLDTLGMLNQTKEFATNVLVSSLRKSEAEALIKSPMIECFGYNTYRTALGTRAVEFLMDISGCHPTFLTRACKEVFDYYVDTTRFPESKTQLTQRSVSDAINSYVSHLKLEDFDILFVEDGDDVEKPEERKTYQYLRCLAELSLSSHDHRTADAREVIEQMRNRLEQTEEERIRGVLQSRHVIEFTDGGRIRIKTGLFLLYIHQRRGRK